MTARSIKLSARVAAGAMSATLVLAGCGRGDANEQAILDARAALAKVSVAGAAPYVSALAGLIIARDKSIHGRRTLNPNDVQALILWTTTDLPRDGGDTQNSGASWDGKGRPNFGRALQGIPGAQEPSPNVTQANFHKLVLRVFGDGFSMQTYVQSHGADLYRRSLYTFWKRSVPPAALATFDAPDREKCVARRAVTNTPLQALTLLNDETIKEASQALAKRLLAAKPEERLSKLYEAILSRQPTAQEIAVLQRELDRALNHYRQHPEDARKLQTTPELAAHTLVATLVFNLDEAITHE